MIPTDVMALRAISLICNNIVTATKDGSNVEARSAMLLGSMMAGFAFNSAVLGLVHSIAHPLSAHFHLPHGVANAIGLPYVMEYNALTAPARFRDIAVAMGIDVTGMSDAAAAQAAVNLVKGFNKELEIPTLKDCGVTKDMFGRIAEDALQEISTLFNPKDPSKEDILAILEKAY
jgi:alcohol dehydrogenase class IV